MERTGRADGGGRWGEGDVVETQGHHRCGSLNLNVRGLGQSATLAINERSNALRREGRRVYKLGLGQSPFPHSV